MYSNQSFRKYKNHHSLFVNNTVLSYIFHKCVRNVVFVSILSSVFVITLYQLCLIFLIVFSHVSEDFAGFFFFFPGAAFTSHG